ncbi:MAG: DUF3795 domain-containing protein [Lachnospiraceae bacterium]|nr:DUF3795 domain-containing protein [Lachnospiraceae bacterium]
MNIDWSEMNKKMQTLIGREATFAEGIEVLIGLRNDLFAQISYIANSYPEEAFYQMPFARAEGYHSKTLAYSMWHIFRIEDIVAHTLIKGDEQVLFAGKWQKKTGSPIITTGNELKGEEIAEFSKKLNVKALFEYCKAVKDSTDELLRRLTYKDLKRKFSNEDKARVIDSRSVSTDEAAFWLVDYWCNKDVRGLLKMPFSRHWIMHIEAMCRITDKLCRNARKGSDPIARCGLSCNHCFLKNWCGGCRTAYNTCSDAMNHPDRICPTTSCCMGKGIDGCYECDDIVSCRNGFYEYDDVNAVKAMALFIRKYGKAELLKTMDQLHKERNFEKIQEVLGNDLEEGFAILEKTRSGMN